MALSELKYFSHALGKMHAATILAPETGEEPMDVLFLLHGLSDDHTAWTRKSNIERHAEGRNVLIVMPDGGRGFYVDAAEGFPFGEAVGEELVRLVRRLFRTIEGRWTVAGLSMGGYGALRLGMGDPDTWRAAHSFSGATYFGHAAPRFNHDEFARVTGPDPTALGMDLFDLAQKRADVAISLDCGTDDFLIDDNRRFRGHLATLGVEHRYEEFDGGHDWTYWDTHVVALLDRWFPIVKSA